MRESAQRSADAARAATARFAEKLRAEPLAVATQDANRQHYEVPPEFFQRVLGPRLKYSACYYESPGDSLAGAEEAMLRLTCQRAGIGAGQRVLELGCGWGSLTLWIAKQYPASHITAVSNSRPQREYIQRQADSRGLTNLRVITADMRDFSIQQRFDRIVSVEMFEHMRNYRLLLQRVSQWLADEGQVFVHIFCHRQSPYLFEAQGADNWMGRHFFTGGMMPSERLFDHFTEDLCVAQQWRVDGLHYWRTCEAWLANLDDQRPEVLRLFARDLGGRQARIAVQRWRMFFMACAELFRSRQGQEWFVGHYVLRPSTPQKTPPGRQARAQPRDAVAARPLGESP